jgi:hypothetical protein
MNKLPFQRHESVQGVEYEMLSSNGRTYYTVRLFGGKAISCECEGAKYRSTCKHQEQAEVEEMKYANAQPVPVKSQEEEKRANAPLNGSRAFSLMR